MHVHLQLHLHAHIIRKRHTACRASHNDCVRTNQSVFDHGRMSEAFFFLQINKQKNRKYSNRIILLLNLINHKQSKNGSFS